MYVFFLNFVKEVTSIFKWERRLVPRRGANNFAIFFSIMWRCPYTWYYGTKEELCSLRIFAKPKIAGVVVRYLISVDQALSSFEIIFL